MADINETVPIAPVLPASTGNDIRRRAPRQPKQEDRERRERRQPGPDDEHHVDEYA